MPKWEKSTRALATTSSSGNSPTVANAGALLVELAAGLAVCATMQIEHEAASVWLG